MKQLLHAFLLLIFIPAFFASCKGKNQETETANETSPKSAPQIGEYVVDIFEDSKGDLWFGTISKGVARLDRNEKRLQYFTTEDGLSGNAVVHIIEDKNRNLWLATHSGLTKFDGKTFSSYSTDDGLCHNRVSKLLIDSKENFWVCTWEGICKFDGEAFTNFELPKPEVKLRSDLTSAGWVTDIVEDSHGNLWFSRDAYGVCKYNPEDGSFMHFTQKEGLESNNVQVILEDRNGNMWFGSRVENRNSPNESDRAGGLNKLSNGEIVGFPDMKGLHESDVYALYEDNAANIWIGSSGLGIYRFDGKNFKLYEGTDRMDLTYNMGVQDILQDKDARLWLGLSGGLFRLEGVSIVNVAQNGPWD